MPSSGLGLLVGSLVHIGAVSAVAFLPSIPRSSSVTLAYEAPVLAQVQPSHFDEEVQLREEQPKSGKFYTRHPSPFAVK